MDSFSGEPNRPSRGGGAASGVLATASGRPRPQAPTGANQVWSYDFVFDWCANGQQLKCLTVTDEWTKEGLAIEVDGRIRLGRVIEVLSRLISERGAPLYLRSDNGPEFVARALLKWMADQKIETALIDPGKPWQNGVNESFMYGRPLRCKVDSEGSASRGSGAFMYAACSCGLSS